MTMQVSTRAQWIHVDFPCGFSTIPFETLWKYFTQFRASNVAYRARHVWNVFWGDGKKIIKKTFQIIMMECGECCTLFGSDQQQQQQQRQQYQYYLRFRMHPCAVCFLTQAANIQQTAQIQNVCTPDVTRFLKRLHVRFCSCRIRNVVDVHRSCCSCLSSLLCLLLKHTNPRTNTNTKYEHNSF